MQKSLTVVVVSMILTLRPWLRDNKLQMYIYIYINQYKNIVLRIQELQYSGQQ